ncbi:hypothetical protein [Seonamhaeicola marinus]|uniref:Uncharacterized protein n=1 Tax=Seonamhaeicola marinus TaxID=1912246 RepID=A0A5D0H415_9FLAO|nr:hypothetical protein [Seonamhaeicola marinus]TYA66011.1 hypothetical protein FUA24_24330 [Seonamhaeicola marinus]
MKKLFAIAFLSFIFACKSDKKAPETLVEDTKTEQPIVPKTETQTSNKLNTGLIKDFLEDTKTLENLDVQNPISAFMTLAETKASKSLALTKDNIKDILVTAKDFKYCVITTGDHTIVKITDVTNCKPSGSWGACMPYATGYIKKGKLIAQKDYMNNIIGLPDAQVRRAYFFE